jgi:hypothetical protein
MFEKLVVKLEKTVTRNSNCFVFCFLGVRFSADAIDSSNKHEENPLKTSNHFVFGPIVSFSFH